MHIRPLHLLIVVTLLLCPLMPGLSPHVRAEAAPTTAPAGLLNPDGTLRLDGTFSGALDLSGYRVQLDPLRGPVFGAAAGPQLAAVAPGQWANLGGGFQTIVGQVFAVAVSGSDVFIGGSFLDANGIPEADYIVRWDGASWSALGSNGAGNGALNNAVQAIAVSGSNVYVGGDFTDVNNGGVLLPAADLIARWDGTGWSALGSNGAGDGSLTYSVETIAVSGSNVYVGGNFSDVNNNGTVLTAADYVARWDGVSWSALGSSGTAGGALNGAVSALAVDGSGNVYVGGWFTDVESGGATLTAADYIARWSPAGGGSWSALGSDGASGGALTNAVNTLAVSGTSVYVGGRFTNVNNGGTVLSAADYVARWDGSSWSALGAGAGGNGALSIGVISARAVYALAVIGGDVYVGGRFIDVSNNGTTLPAADYLARFDGSNWSAVGSNGAGDGALNALVYALGVRGAGLVVGGTFTRINDGETLLAAQCLGSWDGAHWGALATTAPGGALDGGVNAIAVSGTDVYVGGRFTDVANGATKIGAADYVAKWDGARWSALGSDGAGSGALKGRVNAIAISGGSVYVGGAFTDVNNGGSVLTAADYVAKWDGANWSALGSDGAGNGSLNGQVNVIAVSGSSVYVGGAFADVNNGGSVRWAADYIARWNGSSWSSLLSDGAGNGSLNGSVRALAVSGTNVYVGGDFTDVNNGGTPLGAADYLARWDGSSWSAIGHNGAGDGSLNGAVSALAVSGANLYVGGWFFNVSNLGAVLNAADKIARWDGSGWAALGQDASGEGVFADGGIQAIAISGGDVYVGGAFTDLNDGDIALPAADYVARWDGSHWVGLGSGGAGNGALNNEVTALAPDATALYVGGTFLDVNNGGAPLRAADNLAAYGLPDHSPPAVQSITRADASPSRAASVRFAVRFSEEVTGVDAADFALASSGIAGAAVSGVSGAGSSYTVTVATGGGKGTLGLDLRDDDSIVDGAGNPLGGAGAANGGFTGGERYTMENTFRVYLPLLARPGA